MVANGQFEQPKIAVDLPIEVVDFEFLENFMVMENLTGPIIGMMFLQRRHTVLDMARADSTSHTSQCSWNQQATIFKCTWISFQSEEITIPTKHRLVLGTKSQIYPEYAVTGILQLSDLLFGEGNIAFSPAVIAINQGQVSNQVESFTDILFTIKKGLHVANSSIMTAEQIKTLETGFHIALPTNWQQKQRPVRDQLIEDK